MPDILDISIYGWRPNGDPVMFTNLTAPSDVMDLVRCGCMSGQCKCVFDKKTVAPSCVHVMCENEDPNTPADCDADDID